MRQNEDVTAVAAAESVGCNRDVITVLTRHHSTAQGRQQLWTRRTRTSARWDAGDHVTDTERCGRAQSWRRAYTPSPRYVENASVCDFLLVGNSNLGPILHRFGATEHVLCASDPTLFNPNFGGVSVAPDRPYQRAQDLKLFGREIIFSRYVNELQMHGATGEDPEWYWCAWQFQAWSPSAAPTPIRRHPSANVKMFFSFRVFTICTVFPSSSSSSSSSSSCSMPLQERRRFHDFTPLSTVIKLCTGPTTAPDSSVVWVFRAKINSVYCGLICPQCTVFVYYIASLAWSWQNGIW